MAVAVAVAVGSWSPKLWGAVGNGGNKRFYSKIIKNMKPLFISTLKYGAIAGNVLFILWVTYNAIDENFSGTVYEKISYVALMALLLTNCFLLIRSFKAEMQKGW